MKRYKTLYRSREIIIFVITVRILWKKLQQLKNKVLQLIFVLGRTGKAKLIPLPQKSFLSQMIIFLAQCVLCYKKHGMYNQIRYAFY